MSFTFSTEQAAFLYSDRAADIRAEYRRQAEKYADSLRIQTALRGQFPEEDMQPPMALFDLLPHDMPVLVKIAPGVSHPARGEIPPEGYAAHCGRAGFRSLDGTE